MYTGPNAAFSEIMSTTLNNYTKTLKDQYTNNNALLMRLQEKGKVKPFSGGDKIVQGLGYQSNGTAGWYAGYDTLDTTPQDVITSANYDIKQSSVSVTISGLEMLKNSGSEQIFDLLEERIENASNTMKNLLASGIYSDGTGFGGKQIGGLQLLVGDVANSGIVGGIDKAQNVWWRNKVFDATTDGGAAVSSSNIKKYMNNIYLSLIRNNDAPDIIIADNNYYQAYLESLQDIQRITNEKMAQAGFATIKYMNADVVLDGGIGGNCPVNHMYFLNTNYIFLRPHKEREMATSDVRRSLNQDAEVRFIFWAGNMTCSGLKFQGVLKD